MAEIQLQNTVGNLTPDGNRYEEMFGKMTKAYYMNMSKLFSTDTAFFAFAPQNMIYYYNMVVMQNLYWFRGYVPGIHNKGVFSCGLGTNACFKVANMQLAGGFRIESKNKFYVDFLTIFIDEDKTKDKLARALPMKEALGFCMINLDVDLNNKKAIRFTNGNRYFVEMGEDHNVVAFRKYINFITADVKNYRNDGTIKNNTNGYYLIQDRWLDEHGSCFEKYSIYLGPSSIQSTSAIMNTTQHISFDKLPKKVKQQVIQKLGGPILDQIIQLPFINTTGAAIILASKTATGVEDYTCFSDSLLQNGKQYLMEYDITFTDKQLDRALAGKGVILPEQMMPTDWAQSNPFDGTTYQEYMKVIQPESLKDKIFQRVKTISPEENKPFFYQSDYRQLDYNQDLDSIRRNFADSIGISASDLGSHQSNDLSGGDKTKYEVQTLNGISKSTVVEKREMITSALEEIFELLLKIEFDDACPEISVIFNTLESANPTEETLDIKNQLEMGIMSKETAIKRKNPNYTNEEVQKELQKAQEEKQQEMQAYNMNLNPYLEDDYE